MESPHAGNPTRACRRPPADDEALDDLQTGPGTEAGATDTIPRSDEGLNTVLLENPPARGGGPQNPRFQPEEAIDRSAATTRQFEAETERVPPTTAFPPPAPRDATAVTFADLVTAPRAPNSPPTPTRSRVPKQLFGGPPPFLPGAALNLPPQPAFFDAFATRPPTKQIVFPTSAGNATAELPPARFIEVFGEQDAIKEP